jgi:hypothetical protein
VKHLLRKNEHRNNTVSAFEATHAEFLDRGPEEFIAATHMYGLIRDERYVLPLRIRKFHLKEILPKDFEAILAVSGDFSSFLSFVKDCNGEGDEARGHSTSLASIEATKIPRITIRITCVNRFWESI